MDQEIRYAYNAGIDFFIYNGPARKLFRNAWELKNNLDCHAVSKIPEAGKMNFVWALYGHNAIHYTRRKVAVMMDETIEYTKMPNWQKVMDDRPLVIVMWPENFRKQLGNAAGKEKMTGAELIDYIRSRVKAAGLRDPYIVGCMTPARSFLQAQALKKEGYDAFMDYAGGYGGKVAERDRGPTYATATKGLLTTYEKEFLMLALGFSDFTGLWFTDGQVTMRVPKASRGSVGYCAHSHRERQRLGGSRSVCRSWSDRWG